MVVEITPIECIGFFPHQSWSISLVCYTICCNEPFCVFPCKRTMDLGFRVDGPCGGIHL
jgi:hypothetical protein